MPGGTKLFSLFITYRRPLVGASLPSGFEEVTLAGLYTPAYAATEITTPITKFTKVSCVRMADPSARTADVISAFAAFRTIITTLLTLDGVLSFVTRPVTTGITTDTRMLTVCADRFRSI